MYKIDARDSKEKSLSKTVYDLYMGSNDINEYNANIRQLISELEKMRQHKTVSFIKSLLKVYVERYATDREVELYNEKRKAMKFNTYTYINFCDELFAVPAKKRIEYLDSKNESFCKVKEYLKKYRNYKGKYSYLVDDFMREYCLVMAKRKYKEKSRKERMDFNDACFFFDTLIEAGHYSVPDYLESLEGLDYNAKRNEGGLISTRKRKIEEHDSNKWKCYEYKMELNRKRSYFMLQDRIEEFMSQLVFGYLHNEPIDVIDYYMTVGIPFKKFKEICTGHLSDSSMALFNVFTTPYMNIDDKYFDDDSYSKINYSNSETGKFISEEEKLCIVDFLRKNSIPVAYFPVALNKYMNGNLDIKYKSLKKEI